MSTLCLSTVTRKGGVGKTTVSLALATIFGRDDHVLVLDLDSQASMSRAVFGSDYVENLDPSETTAALIAGEHPEPIDTEFGFQILPASPDWSQYDAASLRNYIDHSGASLVIIDTPPAWEASATKSAIVAADFLISPVIPDALAAASISDLVTAAGETPYRLILNLTARTSLSKAASKMIRANNKGMVCKSEIPQLSGFRDFIAQRKPLPRGKALSAMEAVARELKNAIFKQYRKVAA